MHISSPAAATALPFMHGAAQQYSQEVASGKGMGVREAVEVRHTIVVQLVVIIDQRAACIPVTKSDIPQSLNLIVQSHLLTTCTSHPRKVMKTMSCRLSHQRQHWSTADGPTNHRLCDS